MGLTMAQKILGAHAGKRVEPGEIAWIGIDVRTARDFGGANVVRHLTREFGDQPLDDVKKTWFTFDCNAPANTIGYADNQQAIRDFARREGVKVFDVDGGIGSHVVFEQGVALPGGTVVGTDSHLNILGALGCFGQGMGDTDIAFAMKHGRTWFEVPPTLRINVEGEFSAPTSAKDLTLFMVKHFGANGLLGMAAEYHGPAIEKLTLHERLTLASMGTEMGAVITFIPPNGALLKELEIEGDISSILPDGDAGYIDEVTLNVDGLEPLIACPYEPSNVRPVREVAGENVRIDSAFVGSCTNGRAEDLHDALKQLSGARVADGAVLKVVPATKQVFGQILADGTFQGLFDAGALISNQGCGGCASGQIGITGAGEVQVSTSNRNFKGKQGSGQTYLCSPATAAASARAGRIALPE